MIESTDAKNGKKPTEHQFRRELEEGASLCDVRDLEDRGVQKIRVLSETRLHDLMRVAVNRVLRTSLEELDLPPAAVNELRTRSEREFQALLTEGLASESPPAPALPRVEGKITASPDEFRALEDRMTRDLTTLLDKDWRSELKQVEDSNREQLQLLERRISKLVRALESTDRLIVHIQHGRQTASVVPAETTTPSGAKSPLSEKKSQLLQALFQANLKLRELEESEAE